MATLRKGSKLPAMLKGFRIGVALVCGVLIETIFHKHRCFNCKTVWEHSEECGGSRWSHQCPKCGKIGDVWSGTESNFIIYKGKEKPGKGLVFDKPHRTYRRRK